MAWSWSPSWGVGHLVTAAELNTYIRDNLNECGPAVATTTGDLLVGNAANDLKRLGIGSSGQFLKVASSAVSWATVPTPVMWVGSTTLTDTSPGTGAQWGSQEATVSNPSESVNIMAWVSGYAYNIDFQVYVQISTDGGSTWSSGETMTVELATGKYLPAAAFHCVEATVPTGEIQARAYIVGDGSTFYDGFLVMLVTEVA